MPYELPTLTSDSSRVNVMKQLGNMKIDARRLDHSVTDRLIGADIEKGPPEYDPVVQGRVPPPPGYTQTSVVSAAAAPGQLDEVLDWMYEICSAGDGHNYQEALNG